MTATEAIRDRHFLAGIAASARVDPRTIRGVLNGRRGKGLSHEAALKAIRAAGIELPGESPTLSVVSGGKGA